MILCLFMQVKLPYGFDYNACNALFKIKND